MALQYLADRNGWLSFKHSTPVLYITAEDDEFDMETMTAWRDEGFIVEYIPMGQGGKQYVQTLHHLGDKMGIGERYAIVGTQPLLKLDPFRPLSPLKVDVWGLNELIVARSIRRCGSHMSRRLLRAQNRYL